MAYQFIHCVKCAVIAVFSFKDLTLNSFSFDCLPPENRELERQIHGALVPTAEAILFNSI